MIKFLLFFIISIGIFYRKIYIENVSDNIMWDAVLAAIFLVYSLIVLTRAIIMKPKIASGLFINQCGISKTTKEVYIIKWDEIENIYNFPWFIIIKGQGNKILNINFFFRKFTQANRLFMLLATSTPKSNIKNFELQAEIKSLLDLLIQYSKDTKIL